MEKLTHWTAESTEAFAFRISADFVAQLEMRMEQKEIKQQEVAERLGVTDGRVSQVLNNPGNLQLTSMVEYALAVGMKVAVIAYDDNDPDNNKGPVNAQVFTESWERAGSPRDLFALENVCKQSAYNVFFEQNFYRPITLPSPVLAHWDAPSNVIRWKVLDQPKQEQPYGSTVRRKDVA